MNIINLFKNNLIRILSKKAVIIVAFILIPIMIVVAVLFTAQINIKGNIALVTASVQSIPKDDRIQIEVMKEKPAISQLLLGKYDAIVEQKSDGTYKVTSIKSLENKEAIESFFKTGKISESKQDENGKKGVGANILGFILMIVLIQGIALIVLFTEDRDLKTFRRVLTSPVSERQYLFVQGIFTFVCLFIPSYLALVITKVVFGVNIGYSYGMLAILMGILSALSTALALFIASVLKRDYSLAATGIYVITCVLAGCYISFTGNNKILDAICSIIPQKSYITLIQGIENGKGMLEFKGQLAYLLVWIVALWFFGSLITKSKMKRGAF